MAYRKGHILYFYRADGYVEKVIEGKTHYRDDTMDENQWLPLPHSVDRLVQHIQVLTGAKQQKQMLGRMRIDTATICRVRKNKFPIPPEWLVKMSDYTGLTINELRIIGGLGPIVKHYTEFKPGEQ
jgi:hypothetical protein